MPLGLGLLGGEDVGGWPSGPASDQGGGDLSRAGPAGGRGRRRLGWW